MVTLNQKDLKMQTKNMNEIIDGQVTKEQDILYGHNYFFDLKFLVLFQSIAQHMINTLGKDFFLFLFSAKCV